MDKDIRVVAGQIAENLLRIALWAVCAAVLPGVWVQADEPVSPIPLSVKYDRAKALLGKEIFFDKRLSSTNDVSCGTCHDPEHGMADGKQVAVGIEGRKGPLNTPTVYNSYFNFRQFWNGRAWDLKEQAIGPLHNPVEMDISNELVEQRINEDDDYRKRFKSIYGAGRITIERIVDVLVEFEKALTTPNSKFDRYLRGEIKLDADEQRGFLEFKSLGCIACHNGVNLGGNSFQYLGAVNPVEEPIGGDRYEVTEDPFDRNRFKVPSLRNIALTAPYLHNGSMQTLEETLQVMAYHNLGFRLNEGQVQRIIAFLNTLTGERPPILDER